MDLRNDYDETAELRKEALFSGDSLRYYILCTQGGVQPEDPTLFGIGQREFSEQGCSELELMSDKDINLLRDYWSKISEVALPRFPETQRGERVGVSEIKQRLGAIEKAGLNVKPYKDMNRAQLWDYYTSLRREIAQTASVYCPKKVREINSRNLRQKRETERCR
ncbi:MAG: hypothetical protein ABIH72_05140 [archaeon]